MFWYSSIRHPEVHDNARPNSGAWENLMSRYDHPPIRNVRIVRSTDRDQLRTQITGTKTIRTQTYPSKRFRRARYVEAATEIGRVPQQEVEVRFVDAIPQYCRIEADIGEEHLEHVVDFAELYADGRCALIDAKREWSDFRKPAGVKQTMLGEIGALACGFGYERIVLKSLGSDQRRDNIDEIQASRFVKVPKHLVARAAQALSQGPMSLGHLGDILHPVTGRRMAYALMVRRVVEIDLDAKLTDSSECRAVPPLPAGMPSLRQ
ncbi:MAG: hypothetical protein K0R56_2491 [Sphingomonas sp.]|jgi:hypothetical protein|nr:hypothetical protein [Sphingomonas sp.]